MVPGEKFRGYQSDDAKSHAYAQLNFWASQPIRCKCCKRVCAWIDKDGACGSPKCKEQVEINKIMENKDDN